MAGTLFVRLDHPEPGLATWCGSGSSGVGPLSDVTSSAAGHRVIVFVSGADVVLFDATVPTKKRERVIQAVPYTLEEQLAEDVEKLHFAIGRSDIELDDGRYSIPVAVVSKARLEAWLASLSQIGITPDALIPDVLALPFIPGTWTLLQESGRLLLRTGQASGLLVDPEWLSMAIEQITPPPTSLRIFTCPETDSLPPLPTITFPLEILSCSAGSLAVLMAGYRSGESLDLLQGPYHRHEQMGRLWRPWRTAAAIALVWSGLQIIEMATEYHHLVAEEISLRERMAAIYLQAFPDAKRVVNPRLQMEQRLKVLKAPPEDAKIDFLNLLAKTAPIFGATSGIELHTLRYKEGSLDLELSLKNLQLLDQLKQRLSDTGLEVEIQSARAQGDNVEGHLQIRGKG